ncbi:HD-GYP domain, c-di-GMP phosphodiesterase class II (Or its inactivated variant) [Pseudomonas sp. 8Z]|uniref:HD domain-containing phosphohydrolase n=1 Tax=Pseudomonas sp. 8Z TaxID=2653166 RepID=UPI0012F2A0A6|nr:HD domain-containing phosphohydrolase [Pseudomonas sp. 8Z]VXC67902.1 HD-GYP domain, c-di-GMP phosphodiesterase class II (Or its inactivated variant) [Pseudomonas sp. 8Z]
MLKTTTSRERRFPLHVHISVLFTLLLLFTGVVLGLFNYQQTSRLIFSSSNTLFQRIELDVQKDLDSTYRPIRHLLSLLALNPSAQADRLDQRLTLLPLFVQALRDNPKLASIYLGYEDGDFFMVRPLRDNALKQRFDAPDKAAFQVWAIERSSIGTASNYLFYDGSLNLLSRRQILTEHYDPRKRDWFKRARSDGGQITTAPYLFFSTQEIGTTLARRAGLTTVLAADLTLNDLSNTLAAHRVTPHSEVVLADSEGNAVAYSDSSRLLTEKDGHPSQVKVRDLNPALGELLERSPDRQGQGVIELAQQRWVTALSHIREGGPQGLNLALLVPEQELLADAYRIRWQGALITLTTLLLCLPLGWLTSRLVVKSLSALVEKAEAIRRFDFSHPNSGRSPILEVDQLALSMSHMKDTLSRFLDIAASLSAETRFDMLLKRVMDSTVAISEAEGGLLYLLDSDSARLEPQGVLIDGNSQSAQTLGIQALQRDDANLPDWLSGPANGGASVATSIGFDQAGDFSGLLSAMDSPRLHLIAAGLHNRQGETVGVLVLLQRDSGENGESMLSPERAAFVDAVSGSAALCIESQRLLARQKQLLDAFIQLIAGAIDAKSPYTGGHCQRVPEITLMLAEAAASSDAPPFNDYQPTEEDWETLHIAAWLHDCGKVTTPEYVVDKATKLETLYDRIHEIRMRFEVLKRDAWITYWQGRAEGGDEQVLTDQREALLKQLDEEFAFVARTNLGAESMAESDLARLTQIAQRRWLRTLDNRLGVSWEEAKRLERTPAADLPVAEPLLADRPEHLIERNAQERIEADNPWGLQLDEPAYKFNRGELHNLGVRRGTLTAEERYIINHHIVQTILMLSRLPFPQHLQNVAEIAGGHHEKMDGSGYPKRLKREQMSLPARMMAIADIFEALTAADRPYKKGKTLSEALNIMAGMCRDAHIDPDLFALFISSGVAARYAERFMDKQQIDTLNEQAILAKAGLA